MLETNGRVDTPNMRMAAKLADPLEGESFFMKPQRPCSLSLNVPKVTFHRAFDMTRDLDEGGSIASG